MAKKTYIRQSIAGKYIEFPEEINAEYWEGKIGSTYTDYLMNKWIPLSTSQLKFHKDHPTATIKQVIEMYMPHSPSRTLDVAKREKIGEIVSYDNSEDVNAFLVNIASSDEGERYVSMWFTPQERSNYKNSIDSAKTLELSTVLVPIAGNDVELPITTAQHMLAQIQLYADACYRVTETHKTAVLALTTIEEVDAYDITDGYPEKLVFNLNN